MDAQTKTLSLEDCAETLRDIADDFRAAELRVERLIKLMPPEAKALFDASPLHQESEYDHHARKLADQIDAARAALAEGEKA